MSEPARCRCSPARPIRGRRSSTCCARSRPHQLPGAGLGTGAGADRDHRTAPPSSRSATPAAWSWPATGAPPRATRSPAAASRRCSPADDFSGVAIAGAAGPAVEMVKLFQVQLEHYEKIEGEMLSASRARPTSSASWCGPTCPRRCRASWSCRSSPATTQRRDARPRVQLRRHRRPVRGSRLPGQRLGRRPRPQLDQGRLARGHDRRRRRSTSRSASLFAAADEDVATGGPDLVRGIFPTVAVDRRRRASARSTTTTSSSAAEALLGGRERGEARAR